MDRLPDCQLSRLQGSGLVRKPFWFCQPSIHLVLRIRVSLASDSGQAYRFGLSLVIFDKISSRPRLSSISRRVESFSSMSSSTPSSSRSQSSSWTGVLAQSAWLFSSAGCRQERTILIAMIRLSYARSESMLTHVLGWCDWVLCILFGSIRGNWLQFLISCRSQHVNSRGEF